MNDMSNLDAIEPGMPVIGVDGETIGTVESVHPTGIRAADHEIPREAIAGVTERGVTLRIAKTALMARRDPELNGPGGTGGIMLNSDKPRNS